MSALLRIMRYISVILLVLVHNLLGDKAVFNDLWNVFSFAIETHLLLLEHPQLLSWYVAHILRNVSSIESLLSCCVLLKPTTFIPTVVKYWMSTQWVLLWILILGYGTFSTWFFQDLWVYVDTSCLIELRMIGSFP